MQNLLIQNAELLIVKAAGSYSCHSALKVDKFKTTWILKRSKLHELTEEKLDYTVQGWSVRQENH
jgi:hypothetical protein